MKPVPSAETFWQLSEASVRGKAHVDNDLPNQDSVAISTSQRGDVICAVVSDGAGTAPRSGEGSQLAAQSIAERMCLIGKNPRDTAITIDIVRTEFEKSIERVRQALEAKGGSLREFHCTMVAWLYMPGGSFIAQIGDSVALSTRFDWAEGSGPQTLDLFPDAGTTLHEVERGEYANETHFITEADWRQHLRVSKLPADVDAVVLMTDGAMDIAMLRGKVFRGFLSNLLAKLMGTDDREARHATIHAWLDDRQTYGVTGDDKTLFTAVRQARRAMLKAPPYLGKQEPAAPATLLPTLSTGAREAPTPESRPSGADHRQPVPPQSARLTLAQGAQPVPSDWDTPQLPPRNLTWIVRIQSLVILLLLVALAWLGYLNFLRPPAPPSEQRGGAGQVTNAHHGPKPASAPTIPANEADTGAPGTAPASSAPADGLARTPTKPDAAVVANGIGAGADLVRFTPDHPRLSPTPDKVIVTLANGGALRIERILFSPKWVLDTASTCYEGAALTDALPSCDLVIKRDPNGAGRSTSRVTLRLKDVASGTIHDKVITFSP